MEKNYIERMTLRASDCDMGGLWRMGSVLIAMQETAAEHCERLGIGRSVMDSRGVAWVLSRAKVQFNRLPRMGETISVETFPLPPRHLFYPRSNIFRNAEDEEIGRATSLWVIIDIEKRRILLDEFVTAHLPENADLTMPLPLPQTVRVRPRTEALQPFQPVYTDFDLNGHVNNTKYMDWCANALGADILEKHCVHAFDINYDQEILPGTKLATALTVQENAFTFAGFEGEKQCFGVKGQLSNRPDRG